MSDITIRPTRRDDKERIAAAFRALHPRSVYLRFFCHKKELSDAELDAVTECDDAYRVALVATVASGNQETVVGLGEYARAGATAEIAFAVADAFQGRGIASRLLRLLTAIARGKGVSQFEADVLADNTPMLTVFRHSGLPMRESRSEGMVHATLFVHDANALTPAYA